MGMRWKDSMEELTVWEVDTRGMGEEMEEVRLRRTEADRDCCERLEAPEEDEATSHSRGGAGGGDDARVLERLGAAGLGVIAVAAEGRL